MDDDARQHGDSSAKQCHRSDTENVWIQYMNWWEVCQIMEVLCVYSKLGGIVY
jgi:hypothetical protein